MKKLEASEQSIKSLDYLLQLAINDEDKYVETLMSTTGAPLGRLVLAAISRIDSMVLSHSDDTITEFTNMAINNNLLGQPQLTEDGINHLIGVDSALQRMLSLLIVRYAEQIA